MDQYSVEVKSRFSLFLDDSLNNEDPDLLLSKIQSKRTEKNKKEKQHAVNVPEPEKVELAPKEEPKFEAQSKAKAVRLPRQPKTSPPEVVEGNHVDAAPMEMPETHPVPQTQGRGGLRGFSRGFRGGRGFGPRPNATEGSQESQGDLDVEPSGNKDAPYELRGRGRGRGFGRVRGRGSAYTDYREYERGGVRPRGRGGYSGGPRGAPEEEPNAPIAEGGFDVQPEVEMTEESEENGVTVETPEAMEEEPKNYTLEEYKAMKSSAKPAVTLSTKGARKANDGKDVFANMVAHRKLNEVSDEEVEEAEKEPEEPQPFDIDVSFTDRFGERGRGSGGFNNRGFDRGRGANFRGRPRGGRGAFRGESRGRGFGRGMPAEHHAPPPAIYSDQDFPSLK